MNNQSLYTISAELREHDPLCRYVTVQRRQIELLLAQSAGRTSQLAVACDLLLRDPRDR